MPRGLWQGYFPRADTRRGLINSPGCPAAKGDESDTGTVVLFMQTVENAGPWPVSGQARFRSVPNFRA